VQIDPPARSNLVGVVDQVRAARIKLLPGLGQVPSLPAVLRECGESLQEVRLALGELSRAVFEENGPLG
jgi:hypothetical protein